MVRLGVSAGLIERLRNWGEAWSASIESGPFSAVPTPPDAQGIRLARQLQAELQDFEVYLVVRDRQVSARDLSP